MAIALATASDSALASVSACTFSALPAPVMKLSRISRFSPSATMFSAQLVLALVLVIALKLASLSVLTSKPVSVVASLSFLSSTISVSLDL